MAYINGKESFLVALKGDKGDKGDVGASVVSLELIGQDSNGGNIYRQTYSDGSTFDFVAPKGSGGTEVIHGTFTLSPKDIATATLIQITLEGLGENGALIVEPKIDSDISEIEYAHDIIRYMDLLDPEEDETTTIGIALTDELTQDITFEYVFIPTATAGKRLFYTAISDRASVNLYDAEIPVGEVINGKMVVNDGTLHDDSASCATDFIVVNPGSTLYIENCFIQYGRCICAYDDEKNLKDYIVAPTDGSLITETTYTVPNDVRYIRVTGKANTSPKITKINYPINSDLNYLADSIKETEDAIVENNSKFGIAVLPIGELTDNTFILYSTGKTSANNNSAVTDFIPLMPNAKVTIKNAFLIGNRSICGYDGGKQYVQYFAYNTSDTEYIIESVPASVKYIRVTCKSGIAPIVTQEAVVTMNDVYLPPITIEGEFEPGYLGSDGKLVVSGDAYRISPYIAVHPHQEIEVRNFMALGNGALYCYDANQDFVKRFEWQYANFSSKVYQLPFNTYYIRVHTAAGKESMLSIAYTKRAHHDAGTIDLVNEWFNSAHGKIDKLFQNATKKPIITFIDDDTTSVEGVKRFRDICMELGIRGTYACITSVLDGNSTLKDTLLEYQNEGFQIVMHAHYYHNLYAEVDLRIAAGTPPTEEELQTLERDFVTCISRLKSFGFIDTDFWVTPGGSHSYVNDDLMRKWGINCFVTCGNDRLDYEGTNPKRGRYGLVRPSIGADDTSGSQTLAEVKTIIDNASIDNGWVLVCTHMAQNAWADEAARDRFKELVNYARDKGFEVRTLNDAWRIREPIYRLYEMF